MAERYASTLLARSGVSAVDTSSAGTHAVIGHPIHAKAATVLARLGAETANFSARQLSPKIVAKADLVLTMTRTHRDAVLELNPTRLRSTFTLHEAAFLVSMCGAASITDLATMRPNLPAGGLADIDDPIGHADSVFESIGQQIARQISKMLPLFSTT